MLRNPPLAQRLVARAFALGLDPALSLAAQGAHLARLAVDAPGAVELAVRGIEAGPDSDSPWAVQAIEALRVAARLVAADLGGPPGGVTARDLGGVS